MPQLPQQDPEIRLIRANNPSAMTGTGTNTYILGRGEVTVLDPGPDLDGHMAAILAALKPQERIRHVLVTHAHLDHSGLVRRLVGHTGAATYAFGDATSGRSAIMRKLTKQGLSGAGEGVDLAFEPQHAIPDGGILELSGLRIEALHTPGHMGCHLAYAVGDLLFSGDHVMGWSTTMISPPDGDMADYVASLERLSARHWHRMLPGHGPSVEEPARRLSELIRHRRAREAAILDALNCIGPATAASLARVVYVDTPPPLMTPATRNVLAHLIDLMDRGRTRPDAGPISGARFHLA